jgi:hypothetical protein
LRIERAEKFMILLQRAATLAGAAGWAGTGFGTLRTRSPSFRKPAPLITICVSGARPPTTSMRSPRRRPVPTFSWLTRLSAVQAEHVAEAVAHGDRLLRHGQRFRGTELEFAAGEHAGLERRVRRTALGGRST